jgi:hypothetical protein
MMCHQKRGCVRPLQSGIEHRVGEDLRAAWHFKVVSQQIAIVGQRAGTLHGRKAGYLRTGRY